MDAHFRQALPYRAAIAGVPFLKPLNPGKYLVSRPAIPQALNPFLVDAGFAYPYSHSYSVAYKLLVVKGDCFVFPAAGL